MIPSKYYYGILPLFTESFQGNSLFNPYPFCFAFLWSSLGIALLSLLFRSRRLRSLAGISGTLFLYGICALPFLLPMDAPWQRTVLLPSAANAILRPMHARLSLPGGKQITPWQIALGVWGAGILVQGIRLAAARLRIRRVLSQLPVRTAELPEALTHLLPKRTSVLFGSGISVPFSTGLWRRRILIPQRYLGSPELGAILRHETAHLRKYDHLAVLLCELLCVIHWWNPAVYLLRRDLEQELELRCDREAVRGMGRTDTAEYMSSLLSVFRHRYGGNHWSGLGMLGSGKRMRAQLRERFDALERGDASPKSRTGRGIRLLCVLCASLPLLILSYGVAFSPFFLPTQEKLAEDLPTPEPEIIFVVDRSAKIYDYSDGRYILSVSGAELEIPASEVEALLPTGVELISMEGSP